jgi:hypothetical protein
MILERTAAYVLAVACVFQTLHPSGTIHPHGRRSIDVHIGRLRVQARNDASWLYIEEWAPEQKACMPATRPLLHSWQKQARRVKICINDSSCLTAWSDGTSHVWLISRNKI